MTLFENRDEINLETYGIQNTGGIYRNLPTAALYEEIVRRREGLIAHLGPIVVRTGHHTGRSPKDKFIVKEISTQDKIWWGKENKPFDINKFDLLYNRLLAYLQGKDIFVQDCYASADPRYRIPIRIITEYAWHNLFARNIFIQIRDDNELKLHKPKFTIIGAPRFHASPEIDGTNSEAFIIVNFAKRLILIGGTSYAGEIKKAVFTVLNFLLPQEEVLSMHCAANVGQENDVALFFGLSGTGKTTLSTDVNRNLIGDDEHGWSDNSIFNFEGGCYAKVIKISREQEPQIYQCTRRFGTILENVTINTHTRRLNLNDASFTENTRASYPLTHIENSVLSGMGIHPKNIFMLSCDAFGILPPIALLTPEQAAYFYLQGYTARVAGTEVGLGAEPDAIFSPCFGAPFLALPPILYTKLLLEKIRRHKVNCWLINTGWVGGAYGKGNRISLPYTRSLIRAAISEELYKSQMVIDPIFGFRYPVHYNDIPDDVLNPASSWDSPDLYTEDAKNLAKKFIDNIKTFSDVMPDDIRKAGPKI
jgi:phosphoenolpyruvate carboxykinase (ATP)